MKKVSLAIIQHANQILIGQVKQERLSEFSNLPYVFPGGKVEAGEPPASAAVREAKEETSLTVEVIAAIGSRIHPTTMEEIHYFHCAPHNGNSSRDDQVEMTAPRDHAVGTWVWIPLERLEEFAPTLNPEVKRYFRL